MKVIDLYRIESKSFVSELDKEEIKTKLIHAFNLNKTRNLKSFFQHVNSDYQGNMGISKFKIEQINSLSSINDGFYFFFTQISGEIYDNGNERIIKLNAELSDGIKVFFLGSSPIYLLIMIFGSLLVGISCFLFLIFIYIYGRKNVKSDFKIFEIHLNQVITVYKNV